MNGNASAPEVWKEWVRSGSTRQWPTGERLDSQTAGRSRRYEVEEISVSESFRTETFERYGYACTITGIEEEPLLDLAHILPRSDRPDLVEHPENVLVLNTLHHRAFDAGLFTLDTEYRIRVSPSFDPGHPFLKETITEQQGSQLSLPPDIRLRSEFIEDLNAELGWL
jgi:predicted restriction endonuclease